MDDLGLRAAEVLAWDQCTQKERCRVATSSAAGRGFLEHERKIAGVEFHPKPVFHRQLVRRREIALV